jgi:hypothetical protein
MIVFLLVGVLVFGRSVVSLCVVVMKLMSDACHTMHEPHVVLMKRHMFQEYW